MRSIPAVWMRGGTSKGLFFRAQDLPADAAQRDAILLRALGSPDPYGKQIDGLGWPFGPIEICQDEVRRQHGG